MPKNESRKAVGKKEEKDIIEDFLQYCFELSGHTLNVVINLKLESGYIQTGFAWRPEQK